MKTDYTNRELASDYLKVKAINGDLWLERTRSRSIQGSRVSISEYFQREGNLKGLVVTGIGAKTKETLEGILQYGVDQMIDNENKRKMENVREYQLTQRATPKFSMVSKN